MFTILWVNTKVIQKSVDLNAGENSLPSPVGAKVGHPRLVVSWIGLSVNMTDKQKFRDSLLLVSAFLLLDINFNMITVPGHFGP